MIQSTAIKELEEFSFAIVLEFNPYTLLNEKELEAALKYRTDPTWFHKVTTSMGFEELQTVSPSSYFVEIEKVSKNNLKLFLEKHLEREKENEMDEMLRLGGGTILFESGKELFSPNCCTDITDYNNWINLKHSENFETIWIGHPWVLYKTVADNIYLTDYIEANGDELGVESIKYKVNFPLFLKEASSLTSKMNHFEKRVKDCLQELGEREYEKITACILHGICEPKF